MDQQYQNPPTYSAPNTNPIAPITPAENHKKLGPIVAILIIILVIVIGALYLLASKLGTSGVEATQPTNYQVVSDCLPDQDCDLAPVPKLETTPKDIAPITNTTDDLKSLQDDLNASIDGLDTQSI